MYIYITQACAFGHAAVVETLLEAKADIDRRSCAYERDPCDWTPYATARARGHEHVVQLLLKRGAKPVGFGKRSPPPAT